MKIILNATISKLGKIGDVVHVKNGYAKNFLIPSKKAICFTQTNQKLFEERRHEFEQENQQKLDVASKLKTKVEGKDIIIIENASDDGRLYGSVNSLVIANQVNQIIGEKALNRADIFLKKPIKEIGIYEVGLNFHSDVVINARLIVGRSESEIDAMLNPKKEEKKSDEQKLEKQKKARRKKEEEVENIEAEAV